MALGAFLPFPSPLGDSILKNFPLKRDTYNTGINGISQIAVGVSASVLAASLIEIFSARKIIKMKKAKKESFLFFFGSLDQGDAAILIPEYPTKSIKHLVELVPENNDNNTELKSIKEKFPGNADTSLLSFSDTRAAMNLAILFEKNGFKRPELISHDENLDLKKYKTIFVIGLCSNDFLVEKLNNGTLFKVQGSDNGCNVKTATTSEGREILSEKYTVDDAQYEYGLIAKDKSDNTTYFIIGGNKANMTLKCSQYLLDEWETIYDFDVTNGKSKVKIEDKVFALCMKSEKNKTGCCEISNSFVRTT